MNILDDVLNNIASKISKNKKIGIFCSGGFDSTLLLYFLFKTIYDNDVNTTVTIYIIPRHDNSLVHGERVVAWIANKFQSIEYVNWIVGNPDLPHYEQVRSGVIESLNGDNSLLILGDTKNPPDDTNGPTRIKAQTPIVYQPFFNYDKRVVIQLAEKLNILDEIARITHTCTESIGLRCKNCWQCQERAWAFNSLNIADRGLM